ncbi:MAG: PAS domain S-box protein [Clostridia bacterium]|nr:PAS domain S-box protein [Clostridia bacterium]
MKSIQIKIVMVFAILGIIVISGLGVFCLYNLEATASSLSASEVEVKEVLVEQSKQIEIAIYVSLGIYMLLTIIGGFLVTKVVLSPISKLIKSAELVSKKKKYLSDGKGKTEFDDLTNAFGVMNNELTDNLNEATRQKKQIETILLHMTDGIIAFNNEGKIIHINHAAKTFLGVDENQNFKEIFDKYNIDVNLEMVMYLENWTSFERRMNVGGRAVNLFFASFKDENEIPAGVIAVIQDITEHVKLDEMRKEFVADVSHELKTPITSIMGYSDTLLQSNVPENMQKEFLGRISEEANRMSELVSDLLTLSKYDSTKVGDKEEFDLGEVTKQAFDRLRLEADKKNQDAECLITADIPVVYADKKGIERVILNIISNAIKYTPENGTIKVYVGFVYNDAYIKVIDTGIGIPEEELPKVFERFYRVDKSRTRGMGGTGLGLPIAKEILNQNDGKIDIKSEFGKGTEVVIRIPTKQALDRSLKNTSEKNKREDEEL